MFSGESIGGGGERTGEDTRGVDRERGGKTVEAMSETRRQELLERRAALMARVEELEARKRAREAKKAADQAVNDLDEIINRRGKGDTSTTVDEAGSDEGVGAEIIEEADNAVSGAEGATSEKPEEEPGNIGEKPGEGEIKDTVEKAKKKKSLRNYITGIATIGLAGILFIGSFIGGRRANKEEVIPTTPPIPLEEVVDNEMVDGETAEVEKGIYDGYGEAGMWLSENKTSDYAFADAREVAEVCDNDEVEMIKYTAHNQVESFADYLANLPEELQPDGFKGLNLKETEARLESLSPEDYAAVEATFGVTMDNAFTRRTVLNGTYDNAYMAKKDPSGPATHENMEIVRCTTSESNLEVTEFYWLDADGNEIGSMTVKMKPIYNEDGDIISYELCEQVVNKQGTSTIYEGIPEITPETPETPTPDIPTPVTPTPETPETPAPETPETPEPETPETPEPETLETPEPETPETPEPEAPTPVPETPAPVTPTPAPVTPTPTPATPTPAPVTPAPKDAENMTRIDNNIQNQIEYDYGTNEVVIHQETAAPEEVTTPPPAEAYQGTEARIVQNEAAPVAEPVQEQVSTVNDYSEDRGGANAGEYAPVQSDYVAQAQADANATSVSEAPTGGQELNDILGDLGI